MSLRALSPIVLAFALACAVGASTTAAEWQPFAQKAFDMAVASGKGVVLDFHADWCPTCKAQAPILAELLKNEKLAMNGVVALKADFDTETELRKALKVQKQSTIVIFKGGREVARGTGVTDRAALAELIAKAY